MEVYLNVIEWGDGLYGCEPAAQKYFLRSSKTLSPVESAWMAAVLPSPRHWTVRPTPKHVQARQIKIMDTLPYMQIPR